MGLTPEDIKTFIDELEQEMERSRFEQDEKLGLVFYPCSNAIFEALVKSMA